MVSIMHLLSILALLLVVSCGGSPQKANILPPTSGAPAGFENLAFDETKIVVQEDLGAVYAGKDDVVYLNIANNSGRDISLSQIQGLTSPFSLAGPFPGASHTCVNSLPSGGNCQMGVRVGAQTILGPVNGAGILDYADPSTNRNYSKTLNLTVLVRDLGGLSSHDINFGVLLSSGPALVKKLTLRNDSLYETAANIIINLPVGSKFSLVPPLCNTLAPQSSCDVNISFDPVVPMAPFSEDVSVIYDLKGQALTVTNKIRAESKDPSAPQITVDLFNTKKVDFKEDIELGLTIFAPATALSATTQVSIDPKFSSFSLVNDLAKSTCLGATLTAGQSCRLVLKHAGVAQDTTITNENIDVVYNAPQKAIAVNLSGSFVLVKPAVNGGGFAPITVDFGNKASISLTVTNPPGSSFASISGINLMALAGLNVKPASTCLTATLTPGHSCTFDLETNNLTADKTLNVPATLRYISKGTNLTEAFAINGQINVNPLSSPNISGYNFGPLNIGFNDEAEIIMNLTNPAPSPGNTSFPLSNIAPTAIPPGLTYQATSTCNAAVLVPGNSCTLIFKTAKLTASHTITAQNITIGYLANAINQHKTFQLNGQINVSSIPVPVFAGNNFGTVNIAAGNKVQVNLVVTNNTTFTLSDFNSGHPAWVVAPTTTCPTAGNILIPVLAAAANCNLVLESAAGFNVSQVVNDTVRVSYKVGTILNHFVDVTLGGNINVPVTHALTVAGGVGLPTFSIAKGDTFEVELTVTNSGSQTVKNFELKREDPNVAGATNALAFGTGYYIKIDAVKTTCGTANLAAGANCKFVLSFDPNAGTNFTRKLFVFYQNVAGTTTYDKDHTINVSWNFTTAIPAFSVCTNPGCQPWPENANAPTVVNVNAASPGDYFNYTYREAKKAPLVTTTYAQTWWDKLINRWFYGTFKTAFAEHIPWTFKPNDGINVKADGVVERLIDIVPDRVTIGGRTYVKLYHGTSIGGAAQTLLNLFKTGSNALAFNRASTIALGQGLYLAANSNESKEYGCMKSTDSSVPAGSGEKTMLLVVGVQAIPEIVGKQSSGYISTGLAANAGLAAPTDAGLSRSKDIYFKRNSDTLGGNNSNMTNQFVFFEQVKPYLRILEIIVFDDHHYKGGIEDGNNGLGYQNSDPGVPTTKCNYK
jgi:hypothetical protein